MYVMLIHHKVSELRKLSAHHWTQLVLLFQYFLMFFPAYCLQKSWAKLFINMKYDIHITMRNYVGMTNVHTVVNTQANRDDNVDAWDNIYMNIP